jgi:secreted PhoX family phosphatase
MGRITIQTKRGSMAESVDRRTFLRRSATGLAVPASVAGLVAACTDQSDPLAASAAFQNNGQGNGGYGPVNTDQGVLLLPEGFNVKVFGAIGDPMSNGAPTPIAHDGMACFALRPDRFRLVRNHEDRNAPGSMRAIGPNPYDPLAAGGTTTLEVGRDRELLATWVSVCGTIVNCAGGQTPWGSWLTCEETVAGPNEGWGKSHGWVFEVPASADSSVPAVPYKAMGRFSHEAVCVDPATSIVYQTEDNGFPPGSGLFRYVPDQRGDLGAGGKLQMARVMGSPKLEIWRGTGIGIQIGDTFDIDWVDILIVDPGDDPAMSEATRKAALFMQGFDQGGAAFNRLEGCWFGEGSVFFQDTRGGNPVRRGHVWQYVPGPDEGQGGPGDRGLLRLIFESPGTAVLDSPDNITVSPRGGLVLCEDGGGEQWLRGISRSGQIFDFAKNLFSEDEFAGACFSPDGHTLFVNIQGATSGNATAPGVKGSGFTMAIWGPWAKGAL